ncbi:glycosyltransferase family 2 protein [uncultured Psychroserpens sp.]|uniref:glycosyltransferase family 2 protein n=1 Tax=uncultured Psychroserpens sp. TaxID=255436 RepID=UPI0026175FB0|nr:glycosyltransferase family 2 protein [uncultured Psychroserpens sp.]
MKISIITATFNSEKTIDTCINSVLNQTYNDIEYLIIDGNSTDNTLDIVKQKAKQHPHVKCYSEPDKGIYDALNKGISKASGSIIGFVHSDDFLASNSIISEIANTFITHNVDGVYGDLHYVKFDNTNHIVRNWKSQSFKSKLLAKGWMPAHPTLYLKKEIYTNNGSFNLDYKIAADYDFVLRIFKQDQFKFFYLPHTIIKMRVGGVSNRSLKNLIMKTREDFKAIRRNQLKFPLLVVMIKNLSKIPQWFAK